MTVFGGPLHEAFTHTPTVDAVVLTMYVNIGKHVISERKQHTKHLLTFIEFNWSSFWRRVVLVRRAGLQLPVG